MSKFLRIILIYLVFFFSIGVFMMEYFGIGVMGIFGGKFFFRLVFFG